MTEHDTGQRLVLRTLLDAHPRLLDTTEVAAQLPDVPRVPEVFRILVEDGLATRLDDRIGVSRAAVRVNDLAPL